MSMKLIAISALALSLSTPAMADTTIGLGLNFAFGGGKVSPGIGARVFSDDRKDKLAASAGIDYMFLSKSWRGSLGAAYMMDKTYIELNGGYDFGGDGFGLGFGFGGTNRDDAPVPFIGIP